VSASKAVAATGSHDVLDFFIGLGSEVDLQAMFLILFMLIGVRAVRNMVKEGGETNPVEFWHFIASPGPDGKQQWGDINKLALLICMGASTLFVGYSFWAPKNPIDTPLIILFGIWAVFMSGPQYFSRWLRSLASRVVESKFGARVDHDDPEKTHAQVAKP
jgi:hypothetical protein